MKLWRWILLLLVVAVLAAWGWHWVAEDPGQVVISLRGWRVQTTVLIAIVLVLVLWALIGLLGRLLRWPFGAATRRRRRLGHKRLASGIVGLFEGRHDAAERSLLKSARYTPLKAPAQLLEADVARRRGAWDRALERLDQASEQAPQAARVLRARVLREMGRPDDAALLLGPEAEAGKLPPAGWHELVRTRLAAGHAVSAMQALGPLRKTGALGSEAMATLEKDVLADALAQAGDARSLADIWRKLPRPRRNDPELAAIYARHAARHGAGLAAMSELESALRKHWNPELAALYVSLEDIPADQRLRQAESWLKSHADDAVLLAALGSLCTQQGLEGKARHYLERALELQPDLAPAWAALGDVAQHENDALAAARAYRNALDIAAGSKPARWLPGLQTELAPVLEERSTHGVPRLPSSHYDAEDEGA